MSKKIALVDDSEIAREWMSENLAPRGYEVVTHGMSLGIQVFVRRNKPDIVLLDVNMPALNGDMACKLLKNHPETATVAVALYSSMEPEELSQRAAQCGADGSIRKTDDVDQLIADIEKVLTKAKR